MIDALWQKYRSLPGFTRVVVILAVEVVMVGWWMQSGFQASGIGNEPFDAACSRLPGSPHTETAITATWSWFPPGLNCYSDTGGGPRLFHSPSWTAVLAPTIVGIVATLALIAVTAIVLFRAALRIRGRKVLLGGGLLCAAEVIAIGAFPVAFANVGGLAILWGPLALAVSGGLLLAAGRLLRPDPATPVEPAAPEPAPHG